MNAISSAGHDVVITITSEVPRSHQWKEIRFRARIEQLTRFRCLLILSAGTNHQIASTDKCCAERCLSDASSSRCLDQHPRVTRMHRQSQHFSASLRQLFRHRIDSTEDMQKFLSALDGRHVRLVEPVELRRSLNPQRVEKQHHFSQIAPLNFRSVFIRAIQVPALSPKPMTCTRCSASGTALALLGRCATDFLNYQSTDTTLGIVTRHSSLSAVYHMAHAIDGHTGFSDIRRNDDFAKPIRSKSEILLIGRQFTMQWDQRDLFSQTLGSDCVDGGHDFAHARHKNENIARQTVIHDVGHGLCRLL